MTKYPSQLFQIKWSFAGTQENDKIDLLVSTEPDFGGFKQKIDLQKDNKVFYIITKKTEELGSESTQNIPQTTWQNFYHLH